MKRPGCAALSCGGGTGPDLPNLVGSWQATAILVRRWATRMYHLTLRLQDYLPINSSRGVASNEQAEG